jgi:hypothetical protein
MYNDVNFASRRKVSIRLVLADWGLVERMVRQGHNTPARNSVKRSRLWRPALEQCVGHGSLGFCFKPKLAHFLSAKKIKYDMVVAWCSTQSIIWTDCAETVVGQNWVAGWLCGTKFTRPMPRQARDRGVIEKEKGLVPDFSLLFQLYAFSLPQFFSAVSFLLLASCFLLLASCFLLLASCFLLLASCFLLLASCNAE